MFNLLDIIVLVVALVSAILAMIRGFTREFLLLASIIIAAGAAWLFYEPLAPTAKTYIQPDIVAVLTLIIGVFLIVFILFVLLTRQIPGIVENSSIGVLDRTLGFIFGFLRGLVLVMVVMLPINYLAKKEVMPDWVNNAKTMPFIKSGGEFMLSILPDNVTKWLESNSPGASSDANSGTNSGGEDGSEILSDDNPSSPGDDTANQITFPDDGAATDQTDQQDNP